MPALTAHQSSATTKLLFLGNTGAGKTGALASLAQAGYNLRVIDLDNGMDVLANILRDPKSRYGAKALDHVWFETVTDPMKKGPNGKLIPGKPTVWNRVVGLLDNWRTTEPQLDAEGKPKLGEDGKPLPPIVTADFGPVSSWTPKEVLVIDSLSMLCNGAMNFVLAMNNRLGLKVEQSDWFNAQQMIESLLQMLYDGGIKCNVIVCCHIAYIGDDNAPIQGHPASLGKALSPKIGRYFNSMLMARSTGSGDNVKRKILTNSTGLVDLKNTNPGKVPKELPLETGLADYFRLIREGA